MAGHVKHGVMSALCVWGLLSCASSCTSVWAMGPMAPFVAPRVDQANAQLGQGGAPAAEGADGAVPAASGLTGVRLGRQAGAVIDGQWVRKGRTVRGARLIQIQRTRVTLQHPDGHQEIIEMFPPVGGQAGAVAAASTEAAKP